MMSKRQPRQSTDNLGSDPDWPSITWPPLGPTLREATAIVPAQGFRVDVEVDPREGAPETEYPFTATMWVDRQRGDESPMFGCHFTPSPKPIGGVGVEWFLRDDAAPMIQQEHIADMDGAVFEHLTARLGDLL